MKYFIRKLSQTKRWFKFIALEYGVVIFLQNNLLAVYFGLSLTVATITPFNNILSFRSSEVARLIYLVGRHLWCNLAENRLKKIWNELVYLSSR